MMQDDNQVTLQEHQLLSDVPNERYNNLSLVSWMPSFTGEGWGYYAFYKIGAEWIDSDTSLVVTTKEKMEDIDFLRMFMTCFTSDLEADSFAKIYTIDYDKKPIYAPALQNVISPLIVLHFLGVVSRIKALKKGYVHYCENLHKVKGRIQMMQNERKNIMTKRYDRVICSYDEYSEDIPENRLIKKALIYAQNIVGRINEQQRDYQNIRLMMSRTMAMFQNVSDDVQIKEVKQIKGHKLFKDYAEAIRLAKLVLQHIDYSINSKDMSSGDVVPFTIDMSLLYEHYIYGMLHEEYGKNVSYQYKGKTGYPDFLFSSEDYKAILDTKYIPKYEEEKIDTYVIRQLSGYARDLNILKHLGLKGYTETSNDVKQVPCIIIYPDEEKGKINPFRNTNLQDVTKDIEPNILQFYKIAISLPTIGEK